MVHWVNTGENSVIIIFGYCMNDTESYGVAEFNKEGKVLSIEEKHIFAKINYAVVGSYC